MEIFTACMVLFLVPSVCGFLFEYKISP